MIESLDDAQRWYKAVKNLVGWMDRIGQRYWGVEAGERTLRETLHMDSRLSAVEASTIRDLAQTVRDDLDQLAVFLLFSVFEAQVRDRTLAEISLELETPPRHLVLKKAVADAKEAVEHGSFGRLTESFKELDPALKTQVDQIRRYRNWVAHGRRGDVVNNITPDAALERLERFLGLLDAGSTTPIGPPEPGVEPPAGA